TVRARFYVLSTTHPPPSSPLFPYTTLFRSPFPRRHERHRQPVDVLVTASGAGEVPALLRERGGIADDDVPYLAGGGAAPEVLEEDRKSTRLNSSHVAISYAVFCLKKKTIAS